MNKNIIYVLLLVGLADSFVYDQFYPEYVDWGNKIVEMQEKLEKARRSAPKLVEIRAEEEKLQQKLDVSLSKLPSGAQLDDLLNMVIPVLNSVGIASDSVGSKNVEAATNKDIYRVHPIRVQQIKGLSMATVVKLLFELRNFDRIMNVVSFSLARNPENNLYDLDLSIETYSYVEPEAAPAPARPAAPPVPAVPPGPES